MTAEIEEAKRIFGSKVLISRFDSRSLEGVILGII